MFRLSQHLHQFPLFVNPHAARAVAKLAQLIEVQRQIGQRTEQRALTRRAA